ncbi:MAG: ATP-binding protein [Candidatus Nanohalobium sp.]
MDTKEKLKDLIIYWKEFEIPDYMERDFNWSYLESDKILTVTGSRRAGKTFLCFQMMDELEVPEDNILYLNFEDERLQPVQGDELTKLLETYRELYTPEEDERLYLFLDEIHTIPGWEKWVRRISEREKDIKLVITGSSSELLPDEISTELRGRPLNKTVYPFSFKEFLEMKEVGYELDKLPYSDQKPEVKKAFNEYLKYGGFPEVVKEKDKQLKQEILQEYYSTIFRRDIVERYKVENIEGLKDFYKMRIDNFASKMTYSQSKNNLKSLGHDMSKNTVKKYLSYAKNSFLLFELERYTPKTKNRMRYPRKIYPIDTGLVNAVRFNFSQNLGQALETLVFLQLKRQENGEIFYYEEDRECDFIIQEGNKVEKAVQVTESLTQNNKNREINGLIEALKNFDLEKGLILTEDTQKTLEEEGKTIEIKPVWYWQLEQNSQQTTN